MAKYNLMPLDEYGAARLTRWEHAQNLLDFVQEQEMEFGNDKPVTALEFLAKKTDKAQQKVAAKRRVHFEAYINSQKVRGKRVSIPLYFTILWDPRNGDTFSKIVEQYNKKAKKLNAHLIKVYDLANTICYHVTYNGDDVVLHEKPWR